MGCPATLGFMLEDIDLARSQKEWLLLVCPEFLGAPEVTLRHKVGNMGPIEKNWKPGFL